jgi:hypothetical protein
MTPPTARFALPTLSVLAMLLVAAGIWLALREPRLAVPANGRRRSAPILLLGGFYFATADGPPGTLPVGVVPARRMRRGIAARV